MERNIDFYKRLKSILNYNHRDRNLHKLLMQNLDDEQIEEFNILNKPYYK